MSTVEAMASPALPPSRTGTRSRMFSWALGAGLTWVPTGRPGPRIPGTHGPDEPLRTSERRAPDAVEAHFGYLWFTDTDGRSVSSRPRERHHHVDRDPRPRV